MNNHSYNTTEVRTRPPKNQDHRNMLGNAFAVSWDSDAEDEEDQNEKVRNDATGFDHDGFDPDLTYLSNEDLATSKLGLPNQNDRKVVDNEENPKEAEQKEIDSEDGGNNINSDDDYPWKIDQRLQVGSRIC